MKAKEIAVLGLCTSLALVLSYAESFISFGVPGLKVGLPNMVILFLLYKMGPVKALAVSLLRCVIASLLFGSVMSLAYSIAGALVSLAVMLLLKKSDMFSPVAVSVSGGITHNFGQIAVAILVTGTREIAYYLPVLCIGGCIAGLVIGIAGAVLLKKLKIKL